MSQTGLESFGAYPKSAAVIRFGCHGYGCAEDESVVLPASFAANWQRRFDLRKHRRAKAQLH